MPAGEKAGWYLTNPLLTLYVFLLMMQISITLAFVNVAVVFIFYQSFSIFNPSPFNCQSHLSYWFICLRDNALKKYQI